MIRLVATLFVFTLITVFAAAVAAEPEPVTQHLFVSGKDPYPRFRIPALILTPKGTLLAFCEGRRAGRGLIGDIDLVVRRSSDNGQTWKELEVVADDGTDTLGNPCPVIDQKTGTLWLLMTVSPGELSEEQITEGAAKLGTRVLVTSSTDDGVTWATPRDITSEAKQPEWTWYGTGPGVGIQLVSGRLFIPSYHAEPKTKTYRSHSLFSDDAGQAWQIGTSLGDHTSESAALQRADGSLYYSARTVIGKEQRSVGDSADQGKTFEKVGLDATLYDSHCQAALLALSPTTIKKLAAENKSIDKTKPLWIYCYPAGPERRNLTFRTSTDEGRTWPEAKLLQTGDCQYSSLAELPDGTIGCLYESWRDKNYQLYFARVPLSWLVSAN
jgi:sialidase-1